MSSDASFTRIFTALSQFLPFSTSPPSLSSTRSAEILREIDSELSSVRNHPISPLLSGGGGPGGNGTPLPPAHAPLLTKLAKACLRVVRVVERDPLLREAATCQEVKNSCREVDDVISAALASPSLEWVVVNSTGKLFAMASALVKAGHAAEAVSHFEWCGTALDACVMYAADPQNLGWRLAVDHAACEAFDELGLRGRARETANKTAARIDAVQKILDLDPAPESPRTKGWVAGARLTLLKRRFKYDVLPPAPDARAGAPTASSSSLAPTSSQQKQHQGKSASSSATGAGASVVSFDDALTAFPSDADRLEALARGVLSFRERLLRPHPPTTAAEDPVAVTRARMVREGAALVAKTHLVLQRFAHPLSDEELAAEEEKMNMQQQQQQQVSALSGAQAKSTASVTKLQQHQRQQQQQQQQQQQLLQPPAPLKVSADEAEMALALCPLKHVVALLRGAVAVRDWASFRLLADAVALQVSLLPRTVETGHYELEMSILAGGYPSLAPQSEPALHLHGRTGPESLETLLTAVKQAEADGFGFASRHADLVTDAGLLLLKHADEADPVLEGAELLDGAHRALRAAEFPDLALRATVALRFAKAAQLDVLSHARLGRAVSLTAESLDAVAAERARAGVLIFDPALALFITEGDVAHVSPETSAIDSSLAFAHGELYQAHFRARLALGRLRARDAVDANAVAEAELRAKRTKQQAIYGMKTTRDALKELEETSKPVEYPSFNPGTDKEIIALCGRNLVVRAIALVCMAEFRSGQPSKQLLLEAKAALEEAASRDASLFMQSSSSYRQLLEQQNGDLLPPPIPIHRDATSVTFELPGAQGLGSIQSFAVHGKAVASTMTSVTLDHTSLPGTGVRTPPGSRVTVSGLTPNAEYTFALSCYTSSGMLYGTVGRTGCPIVAAVPVPAALAWWALAESASGFHLVDLALSAAAVLKGYLVATGEPLPVWRRNPCARDTPRAERVAAAPAPTLRFCVLALHVIFDMKELQARLQAVQDGRAIGAGGVERTFASEERRLFQCSGLVAATEIAGGIGDPRLVAGCIERVFDCLSPLLDDRSEAGLRNTLLLAPLITCILAAKASRRPGDVDPPVLEKVKYWVVVLASAAGEEELAGKVLAAPGEPAPSEAFRRFVAQHPDLLPAQASLLLSGASSSLVSAGAEPGPGKKGSSATAAATLKNATKGPAKGAAADLTVQAANEGADLVGMIVPMLVGSIPEAMALLSSSDAFRSHADLARCAALVADRAFEHLPRSSYQEISLFCDRVLAAVKAALAPLQAEALAEPEPVPSLTEFLNGYRPSDPSAADEKGKGKGAKRPGGAPAAASATASQGGASSKKKGAGLAATATDAASEAEQAAAALEVAKRERAATVIARKLRAALRRKRAAGKMREAIKVRWPFLAHLLAVQARCLANGASAAAGGAGTAAAAAAADAPASTYVDLDLVPAADGSLAHVRRFTIMPRPPRVPKVSPATTEPTGGDPGSSKKKPQPPKSAGGGSGISKKEEAARAEADRIEKAARAEREAGNPWVALEPALEPLRLMARAVILAWRCGRWRQVVSYSALLEDMASHEFSTAERQPYVAPELRVALQAQLDMLAHLRSGGTLDDSSAEADDFDATTFLALQLNKEDAGAQDDLMMTAARSRLETRSKDARSKRRMETTQARAEVMSEIAPEPWFHLARSDVDLAWVASFCLRCLRSLFFGQHWKDLMQLGATFNAVTDSTFLEAVLPLLLEAFARLGRDPTELVALWQEVQRDKTTAAEAVDAARTACRVVLARGAEASQAQRRQVVSLYARAASTLRQKRDQAVLPRLMVELGDFHWALGEETPAKVAWSGAIDACFSVHDALLSWDAAATRAAAEAASVSNRLLAGVAASRIARHCCDQDAGSSVQLCLVASANFASFFSASVAHPQRPCDLLSYAPSGSIGLELLQSLEPTALVEALAFTAQELLAAGEPLSALAPIVLLEHAGRSWVRGSIPARALSLRLRAAVALGRMGPAFAILDRLFAGEGVAGPDGRDTAELREARASAASGPAGAEAKSSDSVKAAKQDSKRATQSQAQAATQAPLAAAQLYNDALPAHHPANAAQVSRLASLTLSPLLADIYGPDTAAEIRVSRAAMLVRFGSTLDLSLDTSSSTSSSSLPSSGAGALVDPKQQRGGDGKKGAGSKADPSASALKRPTDEVTLSARQHAARHLRALIRENISAGRALPKDVAGAPDNDHGALKENSGAKVRTAGGAGSRPGKEVAVAEVAAPAVYTTVSHWVSVTARLLLAELAIAEGRLVAASELVDDALSTAEAENMPAPADPLALHVDAHMWLSARVLAAKIALDQRRDDLFAPRHAAAQVDAQAVRAPENVRLALGRLRACHLASAGKTSEASSLLDTLTSSARGSIIGGQDTAARLGLRNARPNQAQLALSLADRARLASLAGDAARAAPLFVEARALLETHLEQHGVALREDLEPGERVMGDPATSVLVEVSVAEAEALISLGSVAEAARASATALRLFAQVSYPHPDLRARALLARARSERMACGLGLTGLGGRWGSPTGENAPASSPPQLLLQQQQQQKQEVEAWVKEAMMINVRVGPCDHSFLVDCVLELSLCAGLLPPQARAVSEARAWLAEASRLKTLASRSRDVAALASQAAPAGWDPASLPTFARLELEEAEVLLAATRSVAPQAPETPFPDGKKSGGSGAGTSTGGGKGGSKEVVPVSGPLGPYAAICLLHSLARAARQWPSFGDWSWASRRILLHRALMERLPQYAACHLTAAPETPLGPIQQLPLSAWAHWAVTEAWDGSHPLPRIVFEPSRQSSLVDPIGLSSHGLSTLMYAATVPAELPATIQATRSEPRPPVAAVAEGVPAKVSNAPGKKPHPSASAASSSPVPPAPAPRVILGAAVIPTTVLHRCEGVFRQLMVVAETPEVDRDPTRWADAEQKFFKVLADVRALFRKKRSQQVAEALQEIQAGTSSSTSVKSATTDSFVEQVKGVARWDTLVSPFHALFDSEGGSGIIDNEIVVRFLLSETLDEK